MSQTEPFVVCQTSNFALKNWQNQDFRDFLHKIRDFLKILGNLLIRHRCK